ncbi:MAG TPA: hypothetical protein VFJ82_05725 [Longimicrobium sp.]|nr:hypothetical protein [Longimicrobium sp.]
MNELRFQLPQATFSGDDYPQTDVYRARVPGGWLVMARTRIDKPALTFVPARSTAGTAAP